MSHICQIIFLFLPYHYYSCYWVYYIYFYFMVSFKLSGFIAQFRIVSCAIAYKKKAEQLNVVEVYTALYKSILK